MRVTDEQIMAVIKSYTEANGFPPSMREIGEATGLRSAGSVRYRLKMMRKNGLVSFDDRKARTLKVLV